MPPGLPPLALFTTLARNPRVFQRFMAGGLLDKGSITLREREIVIDRTTARCGSEYEWGVHVSMFANLAGLSDAQVDATKNGPAGDTVWSRRESLLVSLVDALHDESQIGDTLWRQLKSEFGDEQLIECIVLVGYYHTVSFVTNALCIPPEEYAAKFPA